MWLTSSTHQWALLSRVLQHADMFRVHSLSAVGVRWLQEKRLCLPQHESPKRKQDNNAHAHRPATAQKDNIQLIADVYMDLLTARYGPRIKTVSARGVGVSKSNNIPSAPLSDLSTDQLIEEITEKSSHKHLLAVECQLIKHRYRTPLAQALKACHAFYKVQHTMLSYLPALFGVIEEMLGNVDFSPEDVTFLFLYVFLHGSAPDILFHQVEEYLLKNLKDFHINDLGVVCAGFFRANRRIISQDLLDGVSDKLLSDFKLLDPSLLMMFMKVFRHASYVRPSFYAKLGDCLMQDDFLSHYNSANPLMHIAFMYASIQIVHTQLFEQLLCHFEALLDQKSFTRTKDLSKFIWACGTLQFRPQNYKQRFLKIARHFKLSSMEQFPESLADLLVGLAYLEIFPSNLLSMCLSPDVASRLTVTDSVAGKDRSFQLLMLNETVKIECSSYLRPTLSEDQRKALLRLPALASDTEYELKTRAGLAAVLESLQWCLGTERVRCHIPLPHFKTAVIELQYCMPKGFVQVSLEPPLHPSATRQAGVTQRALTDRLHSILTEGNPAKSGSYYEKRIKVAIVLTSMNQQAMNTSQLLGNWCTKLRQLQKLGYKICQIPVEDANKLEVSSHEERCHLLSQHLSLCLATTINLPSKAD